MIKQRVMFLAAFLSLSSASVGAEPTDTVRWLINEPASLFDIAMIRMRIANETRWTPELLKKLDGKGLSANTVGLGNVVYTWEENRITITAALVGPPTEETCAGALPEYKNIIAPSTGKYMHLLLGSYFDHVNYQTRSRPQNLDMEISKLLVFTVGISEKPGLGGKSIYCSCTLEETSPSYRKFNF